MNWKNEFELEPGPYQDPGGKIIVVTDLITHMQLINVNMIDQLKDPLVVTRPLLESTTSHERIAYPLSMFKQKFKREK